MSKETVQPNDATRRMRLATSYGRSNNPFGLVDTKTVTWTDPFTGVDQSAVSTVGYDARGRYPVTQTNALQQSQTHAYVEGTGAPQSVTDPNGLTVNFESDGFGRVTLERHLADGNEVRTARKQCGGDGLCPASTALVTVVEHFNGSARTTVPQMSFVDSVGHVLRTASYGTDGVRGTLPIVVDQYYEDALGHLTKVDQPRFNGDAVFMAKFMAYDDLNRVTLSRTLDEAGNNVDTLTDYAGLTTTITNAMGYQRIEKRDALGRLADVTDPNNGHTSFRYDAFGNLRQTTDPGGNIIAVTFDDMGRKTALNDPDLGAISYLVDARGLVPRQVSPNHTKIAGYQSVPPVDPKQDKAMRMEYDVLGRMVARYEPDLESHWVFDQQPGGNCQTTMSCGQLVEAFTGTAASKDYRRTHAYDSKGRPGQVWQQLYDGGYTSTPDYDSWSRVVTQNYRRNNDPLREFDQRYDGYGALVRIERQGLKLWEAKQWDAAGRVLSAALGNGLVQTQGYNTYTARFKNGTLATGAGAQRLTEGYTYDVLGNVATRTWAWDVPYFTETFDYDRLNRIDWSEVTGQARQYFSYDATGNITSKTGVGNYTYGGVQPHAVQSITGSSGVQNFSYDPNGNRTGTQGRTESWTSFDMPNTLSKTIAGTTNSSQFVYGPEHQRTRQIKSGDSAGMVVYAGAQEVETVGSVTKVKTYWPMGLGVEIDTNGTTALYWSHKDNLGSPVALSDANGNLQERMAYDVWGKRRTLNGAPDASGTPTPDGIDGVTDNRGFTGHEMLDQIDLVHMNGRVYDPLVARFLSADPYIQDPTNGQSYNRFAYVLNNPTNMTDPTGFIGSRIEDMKQEKYDRLVAKINLEFGKLSQGVQQHLIQKLGVKLTNVLSSSNIEKSGVSQANAKNNSANKPLPAPGTGMPGMSGMPAKPEDGPNQVDFSRLQGTFDSLWSKSFPNGKSQENGGTLVTEEGGQVDIVNLGGGHSGTFSPNLNVGIGQRVLGAFHTHPYDASEGGYTGISLSGGDAAYMINLRHNLIIAQSGSDQFMYMRSAQTPRSVDFEALNSTHNGRIQQLVSAGASFKEASRQIAIETAKGNGLIYYEGRNGIFTRKYP